MTILLGTDEAGYGPNLGPLVVAATAWDAADDEPAPSAGAARRAAPAEVRRTSFGQAALRSASPLAPPVDLYTRLGAAVSRAAGDDRLAIADSKALYKPGAGLRQLERGVHAALAAVGPRPACWSQLVAALEADPADSHRALAWHQTFDCPLPVDAAAAELGDDAARLAAACAAAQVRPLALRARLVYPAEFNALCDTFGSKGAALSHVTVGLLRELIDQCTGPAHAAAGAAPLVAVCDKHGARNRYAALLQHHFAEHWIEPICEGHAESVYEWGPPAARVRVIFRMRGEEFLPTALASMTAKYLRELAMRAFNEFWCGRVAALRPTAGYPGDAPRFKREIDAAQQALGIDDRLLWRDR